MELSVHLKQREHGPIPSNGAWSWGADQPWKLNTRFVRAVGELDENGVRNRFEHREIVQAIPDPHRPEPVTCAVGLSAVALDEIPNGPSLIMGPHKMEKAVPLRILQAMGLDRLGKVVLRNGRTLDNERLVVLPLFG